MNKYSAYEMTDLTEVKDFWNAASCGEVYATGDDARTQYERQGKSRYQLEPYLLNFAKFETARDKDVLEIGVGMGADHQELAENKPKSLTGIDLTERSIEHVKSRFALFDLTSKLETGNAESLHFPDSTFDLVYSWGVIHHSPNTAVAAKEIHRVLRQGGVARVMIYHRYSLVGLMLWARYALIKGKPWISFDEIYSKYLESPGTKAYTVEEGRNLFSDFSCVDAKAICSFGDLLIGEVGQRHKGSLLSTAKVIWPRFLIKSISKHFNFGLYLLIEARK